jgi:hypothetical protein
MDYDHGWGKRRFIYWQVENCRHLYSVKAWIPDVVHSEEVANLYICWKRFG